MTEERARLLAWIGFAFTVASIPVSAFMLSRQPATALPVDAIASISVAFVGALAFGCVGALIVSRHPRHAIGWLFSLSGLATAAAVALEVYGELSMTPGWSLPVGTAMKAVSHVLLQAGVFLPLTLGLLLFPDGSLPSRWWWPAAVAAVVGLLLRLLSDAMPTQPLIADLGDIGVLLTIGSSAAGLASLVVRWRPASREVKQQLKWMGAAATVVVLAFLADVSISVLRPDVFQRGNAELLLFAVTYTCVPIAAGTAILRYGLYEIDLIINRAIVYVTLTALLAGLYAGCTALFQRAFVALTGQTSDAAIVITIAMLATIFTPARNGLQRGVDARFKDAKDLERQLESLEREVESVVDVMVGERLAERLLKVAREGAGAFGAALFLNGSPGDRPALTVGEWKGEAELVVPLRAEGRELGRIALAARRHGGAYAPRERERLQRTADVVAIGLSLANERRQNRTFVGSKR